MINKINSLRLLISVIVLLSTITASVRASANSVSILADGNTIQLKPYKVLVVVGAQMHDSKVIQQAGDFGDIVGMLKLWDIPFDILRLDLRSISINDFVNNDQAKYGAIIWTNANQNEIAWQPQDYHVLEQVVEKYHIGLICIGNKIQIPEIQTLLGLAYIGFGPISEPVAVNSNSHYVIRGMEGQKIPAAEAFPTGGPKVKIVSNDVINLASAGDYPQLTVRTVDSVSNTHVVWIGGQSDDVFHASPTFIKMLQRSLFWTIGYGIYKDYRDMVVLRMDDPGGAQGAYLASYHYPQLSQSTIEKSIIAPLQLHGAKLGVGFNSGFPWIPTKTILHSISINFIDPYGTHQDIQSTYQGLLEGLKSGVFEIQSHGLTHMVPDLDTSVVGGSNWWNGGQTGEWADLHWYREFFDARRNKEVDNNIQRNILIQSADWIQQDFGRRPLIFIPGGNLISGKTYIDGTIDSGGNYLPPHFSLNNTDEIASEAGYGLALDASAVYLGKDYVIAMKACTYNEVINNINREVPAVYLFHDKDIADNNQYLEQLLNSIAKIDKKVSYMSMYEWAAYLHSQINLGPTNKDGLNLTFSYDPYYGRYFIDHSSMWNLQFSDELLNELHFAGMVHILVDGTETNSAPAELYFKESNVIKVPEGTGLHSISFEFDRNALILLPISNRALKIALVVTAFIAGIIVFIWYLRKRPKKVE